MKSLRPISITITAFKYPGNYAHVASNSYSSGSLKAIVASKWPQRTNLTSDLRSEISITLASMCMLPLTGDNNLRLKLALFSKPFQIVQCSAIWI